MKTLSLEQMENVNGGDWLNNHTWREHLICMGIGALGAAGGPVGVIAAMSFCYMLT
jgi:hypothetical protein